VIELADDVIQCPFCAEAIKEDAVLCIHCRQNITIPKPLVERNKQLLEQNERLTDTLSRVRYELFLLRARQDSSPGIDRKKEAWFFALYVGAPAVLLVIAFTFLLLEFSGRFLSAPWILIAFPFGYDMLVKRGYTAGRAVLAGVLTGLAVDILGSTVVWMRYDLHLWPHTGPEWRDWVVTLVVITLAFLSGNLIASFVRGMRSRPDLDDLNGVDLVTALLNRSSTILGSVDKTVHGILIVVTSAAAVYLQVTQLITRVGGG
jgi:hypothetical protein